MDLHKEQILITGAGGFVGAVLARRLIAAGARPHLLVRPGSDLWRLKDVAGKADIHAVDLGDAAGLSKMASAVKPTVIFHLAAYGAYPHQTDLSLMLDVNVTGTLNLLNALGDYKVFVNTGSSSEYGFKAKPMREDDALAPNSGYAVSKAGQTLLCQYEARMKAKNIVTVRLFSVYGPYEEPTRLIPTIIRHCLAGTDLDMVPPETARDLIYVDDVADAYIALAGRSDAAGEIFNLGNGIQLTLKQVADEVMAQTGSKAKLKWGAMPPRIWDSPFWVADMTKTRAKLGFKARTPLTQGLAQTIDWVKQHG